MALAPSVHQTIHLANPLQHQFRGSNKRILLESFFKTHTEAFSPSPTPFIIASTLPSFQSPSSQTTTTHIFPVSLISNHHHSHLSSLPHLKPPPLASFQSPSSQTTTTSFQLLTASTQTSSKLLYASVHPHHTPLFLPFTCSPWRLIT